MSEKVGFVGLGNMGLPMSLRLLEAGHGVVGCDVQESARKTFCERGGIWADSPREVASQCAIVMASLPTPAVVELVALGKDGVTAGTKVEVFIDLSTTGPEMAKRVSEALKQRGIVAMDAPVSGGIAGAAKGTLSVMTAGPKESYERVKDLLACFGKNVFYVGEQAGAGQLMKLINNLLSATTLAASCEALCVGMKGGLDPQTMLTVLNASTGRSGATEDKIPRYVLPGVPINFGLDLSFKDVSLCVEAGEALQVPMYCGRTIRQIWHHAMSKGGPDQDMMDVSRCIEDWAGVKLTGSKPASK